MPAIRTLLVLVLLILAHLYHGAGLAKGDEPKTTPAEALKQLDTKLQAATDLAAEAVADESSAVALAAEAEKLRLDAERLAAQAKEKLARAAQAKRQAAAKKTFAQDQLATLTQQRKVLATKITVPTDRPVTPVDVRKAEETVATHRTQLLQLSEELGGFAERLEKAKGDEDAVAVIAPKHQQALMATRTKSEVLVSSVVDLGKLKRRAAAQKESAAFAVSEAAKIDSPPLEIVNAEDALLRSAKKMYIAVADIGAAKQRGEDTVAVEECEAVKAFDTEVAALMSKQETYAIGIVTKARETALAAIRTQVPTVPVQKDPPPIAGKVEPETKTLPETKIEPKTTVKPAAPDRTTFGWYRDSSGNWAKLQFGRSVSGKYEKNRWRYCDEGSFGYFRDQCGRLWQTYTPVYHDIGTYHVEYSNGTRYIFKWSDTDGYVADVGSP